MKITVCFQNHMKAIKAMRTRGEKMPMVYRQDRWLILTPFQKQHSLEFMMSYAYGLASRIWFTYWPACTHISVLYF
jgi:hypothetical protein